MTATLSADAYHRRMTEAQLQACVVKAAGLLGWRHFHDTFAIGSDPGFPDLILCRPPRLLAIELKRDGKRPSQAQAVWLEDLGACGVETFVWTPSDWHGGVIDEVLR